MTWTAGTWRAVAIGDSVLGADGYPWHVTEGLINHFDVDGDAVNIRVTMERDGAGSRTGDLSVKKPVKYEPIGVWRVIISCYACQRGRMPCEKHTPEGSSDRVIGSSPDVSGNAERVPDGVGTQMSDDYLPCSNEPTGTTRESFTSTSGTIQRVIDQQEVSRTSASYCPRCNYDTHRCPGCGEPLPHGTEVCAACDRPDVSAAPILPAAGDVEALPESSPQSSEPRPSLAEEPISCSSSTEPPHEQAIEPLRALVAAVDPAAPATQSAASAPGAPAPGAPYVEYDDAERAAARALRQHFGKVQVIERVMTLEGLTSHLGDTHGHALPDRGPLIGVEYRAVLADLHFELHAAGQEPGEKWTARGRTPHTHPVMDRPMENPQPRSWAKPLS